VIDEVIPSTKFDQESIRYLRNLMRYVALPVLLMGTNYRVANLIEAAKDSSSCSDDYSLLWVDVFPCLDNTVKSILDTWRFRIESLKGISPKMTYALISLITKTRPLFGYLMNAAIE
jgi:hypothetical protein